MPRELPTSSKKVQLAVVVFSLTSSDFVIKLQLVPYEAVAVGMWRGKRSCK